MGIQQYLLIFYLLHSLNSWLDFLRVTGKFYMSLSRDRDIFGNQIMLLPSRDQTLLFFVSWLPE